MGFPSEVKFISVFSPKNTGYDNVSVYIHLQMVEQYNIFIIVLSENHNIYSSDKIQINQNLADCLPASSNRIASVLSSHHCYF